VDEGDRHRGFWRAPISVLPLGFTLGRRVSRVQQRKELIRARDLLLNKPGPDAAAPRKS
jgi:hypothetical protein